MVTPFMRFIHDCSLTCGASKPVYAGISLFIKKLLHLYFLEMNLVCISNHLWGLEFILEDIYNLTFPDQIIIQ